VEICSGDRTHSHDEVCYEGNKCPVCEAQDDATDIRTMMRNLEADHTADEEAYENLEEKYDSLKDILQGCSHCQALVVAENL